MFLMEYLAFECKPLGKKSLDLKQKIISPFQFLVFFFKCFHFLGLIACDAEIFLGINYHVIDPRAEVYGVQLIFEEIDLIVAVRDE